MTQLLEEAHQQGQTAQLWPAGRDGRRNPGPTGRRRVGHADRTRLEGWETR